MPTGYDTDHNFLVELKRKHGFNFLKPVHIGAFRTFDGVYHIATDGIIAWRSQDCVGHLKKLYRHNRPESPFFSNQVEELSESELRDMFESGVGSRLVATDLLDGTVELKSDDGLS